MIIIISYLNIAVVINFIMDRFNAINNINRNYGNREINNALATNLLPITLQPPPNNPFNQPNFLNQARGINAVPQQLSSNLPISITSAQRQTINPYNGLSQMTTANPHESRFGQIMYENGAPKSKGKHLGISQPPPSGFLSCLLPGVIIFFLLIFVISCIIKHNKHPLSGNSIRYYLNHPNQIKDSRLAAQVLLASQDQSNFQNPESGGFDPYTPDNNQGNIFETNKSELPNREGACREGLHYLNGLCYPCKVGYWDGVKCTTQPIKVRIQSSYTPSLQPVVVRNNTPTENRRQAWLQRYNKDFIANLNSGNVGSHPDTYPQREEAKCRENEFLLNGKCIGCPNGLVWNGRFCERKQSTFSHSTESRL